MSIFKERQMVRQRKQWLKRLRQLERILFSLAIVLIGLAALYGIYRMVFFGSAFAVERIVVEGKWNYTSAHELAELAGVEKGENLFWTSVGDVYGRLRQNPWVRKTAVRRRLPDTLWIYAEEYQPRAIIASRDLVYVDEHGQAFKSIEPGDDKDFPVLTGVEVGDGGKIEGDMKDRVLEMLDILRLFEASAFGKDHDVAEIHYDGDYGYSVVTKQKPIQILLGYAAFEDSFSQLDRMRQAIESRPGRIIYMLMNEPGRLIVKYLAS